MPEPIYRSVPMALCCAFGMPKDDYPKWSVVERSTAGDGDGLTAGERIAQDAMVRQCLSRELHASDLAVILSLFEYQSPTIAHNALWHVGRKVHREMEGMEESVDLRFIVNHVVADWSRRVRDVGTQREWAEQLQVSAATLCRRKARALGLLNDWRAAAIDKARVLLEGRGWI